MSCDGQNPWKPDFISAWLYSNGLGFLSFIWRFQLDEKSQIYCVCVFVYRLERCLGAIGSPVRDGRVEGRDPSWPSARDLQCVLNARCDPPPAEHTQRLWSNTQNKHTLLTSSHISACVFDLSERSGEGVVWAVESSSELWTDALGQFSSAETLDGVLSHFTLPLGSHRRRIDPSDPVNNL